MAAPKTPTDRDNGRRAWPVSSLTSWDVASVRSALLEHERGTFSRSALLIDYMERDDRLYSIIETLTLGIVRLPVRFEPGEGDGRRTASAMAEYKRQWPQIAPEVVQLDVVRDLAMAGLSLCQLRRDAAGQLGLRHWHLSHLSRDEYSARWLLQTRDGQIEIRPGDGQWVLFALKSERPWMAGAVRNLAAPWLLRQFMFSDWNQHQEARGGGVRKAIVPAEASDTDKKRFTDAVSNLGAETTVECPRDLETGKGWDVEFEDASGDASIGFERLIKRCDTNYAVRLLGQDMAIESPGVYVPNRAYGKIQQDRIQAFGEVLSTTYHDQVAKPWAAYHYDDAELAPWARADAEPPVDKDAAVKILRQLVETVAKAQDAKLELDLNDLGERFGFVMKKAAA